VHNAEVPKRLPPKEETIKLLLLRSGNECAFPGCNQHLFNDNNILIGECCHIESAMPGGERFNPLQSNEDRRSYDNLLFLCHEHHVETDDEHTFPAEKLKKFKLDHEKKFRGKPFEIKPGYVEQVLADFEELKNLAKENLEVSKSIAENQKTLIDILQSDGKASGEDISVPDFAIPANSNIIGRRRELQVFDQEITRNNTLQIGGIRGVGKTSFLAKTLKNHQNAVWIDCGILDKNSLLYSIGSRLANEYGRPELLNNLKTADTDFRINLAVAAKEVEITGLWVILDNVNDRLSEFIDVIKEFNKVFINARLIFTSNSGIATQVLYNPHFLLHLSGLDNDESMALFKTSLPLGETIDDDLFDRMSEVTQGHPYIIKLVAVLSQQIPVRLLFEEFEELPKDEINDFIKRKIFDSLSLEERELLISFSALRVPFHLAGLSYFSVDKNATKSFFQVVNKFLVVLIERFTGTYFLHDLIRNHINSFLTEEKSNEVSLKAVSYLESIEWKNLDEWIDLVELSLEVSDDQKARAATHSFLAKLLAAGYFQMASDMASDLLNDRRASKWDFVYLVMGRVYRLQGDSEKAIEIYKKGLDAPDGNLKSVLTMELAAVTFNLSHTKRDENLYQEALTLYEQMLNSGDSEVIASAYSSLAAVKVRRGQYDEAIADLELALKNLELVEEPKKNIAAVYQTLGDSYSKKQDYHMAIDYYGLSLTEYQKAIEIWGMNVFEGIYYLYNSIGWTYSKVEHYKKSAANFLLAYDLAKKYNFPRKIEQAFFDYSYNLLLAGDFDAAADNLFEHYQMISKSGRLRNWDPNLILGSLMMANWCAGRVTTAIAFMGGLINYFNFKQIPNPITIVREEDLKEKLNFNELFKKQIYVLILMRPYSFNDLRLWISEVIELRPDLKQALTPFMEI